MAKKLVVNNFWLVVNGDWVNLDKNSQLHHKSINSKLHVLYILLFYNLLQENASRFNFEITYRSQSLL